VLSDITAARDAALRQIDDADDLDALAALAARLTGKKSELSQLKTRLGTLETVDQKRAAGQAVNEALASVDAALEARRAALTATARAARVEAERLDLTEHPAVARRGHPHLVTQAWERLEDVFVGLGFRIAEGPEVETDWHNFEALNMGEGHPARGEFDTLFVDHVPPGGAAGQTVLRTHTSPVQIRTMLEEQPPIYIVAPGRVFHQIEGLVVDHGITMSDLAGTIEAFTHAFFGPGFTSRLRPSYFPFTEPSAEFDIQRPNGEWIELGGCGMVHPNVLRAGGLDPERWSGFAFGFGIDRMAKERHGIEDIREMYTNDIRFLEQF
jgi:phenylalanyl-tRNA synthetase alpha chain